MDYLPQRIRDKIKIDWTAGLKTPCWLWQGGDSGRGRGGGYGKVWWEGQMRYFHVVVWKLSGRYPPSKRLQLDHECCVRNCGNPEHLRLRTQSMNCKLGWKRRKAKKMEVVCVAVAEVGGQARVSGGLERPDPYRVSADT